jgi:ketosteroid isomerase-like protein
VVSLSACQHVAPKPADTAALRAQLEQTERAFAKTMADRDFAAFQTFLADDAVFLNGGQPLHGKAEIASHWQRLYQGEEAPFSWEPDRAEVLASGELGQTSGPVRDPEGHEFARFHSTWRRVGESWRIVFDDGDPVCECRIAGKTP